MTGTAWIVVAAVIIVAIVVIVLGWIGVRRQRLRSKFGPEYQRVATQSGSKWRADSELTAREKRRQQLQIRPLSPETRSRYATTWQEVQAEFVDQPYQAVARADELVGNVMQERGYPMRDFEEHAADLSVDYPKLVDNYRSSHAIATKQKSANTEELRTAMLHYRALFQELLGEPRDGQRAAENVQQREIEQAPAPAAREGRR